MRESPRPAAAEVSVTPKNVGRYQCEVRLGGDGWFETFRARVGGLQGFDRVFAVQCLSPGALARRPQAAENLLRAARAAAEVRDIRIAAVHDSGLAPGSAFVAGELVHGLQLRALVSYFQPGSSRSALPPSWETLLAYIGAEIAGALAAAHGRAPSVVHGALAPSAVMVTAQGAVKLLDLGLRASVLTPVEIATHPSRGPFSAPEVSRGETPGALADVFALGAVLYALATGSQRREPAAAGRGLPVALAPVLNAMLADRASARPSAAEAEKRLREVVTRVRSVDVRAELGSLVRLVTQVRASQPELGDRMGLGVLPGSDTLEDAPMLADASEFADEPTAIVGLNGDGAASQLASLLRDMRKHDPNEDTSRTHAPEALNGATPAPVDNAPTPHAGTVMGGASSGSHFELEPQMVMNAPLPFAVTSDRPTPVVALPAGAPANELQDLTTQEIHARVGQPSDNGVAARRPTPALTPVSWQPGGDLEANVAGERPGSLGGIEVPGRSRASRTWVLVAAGGAMALLVVATVMLAQQRTRAHREAATQLFQRIPDEAAPVIQPLVPGSGGKAAGRTEGTPSGKPAPAPAPAPSPASAEAAASEPIAAAEPPAPTKLVINAPSVIRGGAAAPAPQPAAAPAASAPAPAPHAAGHAPAGVPPAPPVAHPAPPPAVPAATAEPVAAAAGAPATGVAPAELELRTSPPGATVWMAGAARGVTPLKLAVPPGARDLRLVRPGYETKLIPLDGTTGRVVEQTLNPTSAPAWGDALVSIECPDSRKLPVIVDGREIGLLCPTGFFGLAPGPHEIGVLDPATGDRHLQTVTLAKGQRRLRLNAPAAAR